MLKRFSWGAIFCGFLLFLSFTGCSDRMGYSVLLWSVPEQGLDDGELVPVYIKSNISQTYVIGTMDSDVKFEVPLWQITEPSSKSSAKKSAAKYLDYQYQYARVALDGLPMRAEPVNTAKQVYRLRKEEVIKVLYKGTGAAVMSGSNAMEGDWLRVLTSDGTLGWCFSYNLRLFDNRTVEDQDQTNVAASADAQTDSALEDVLSKLWYPDSYRTMIQSRTMDLEQLEAGYHFDTGSTTGSVQLNVPGLTLSFPYVGVEKTGAKNYKFTDTPISITIHRDNYIAVQYTDDFGRPTSYDFVTLSEALDETIASERQRRQQLYAELEAFGPSFASSNYGKLTFTGADEFQWSGYRQLQPSIIPQGALGRGFVSFKYFLAKSLTGRYDGVITLDFENGTQEVNFFYKVEDNGLRLEVAGTHFNGKTITDRNSNPVVIFFSRQNTGAIGQD